MNTVSPASTGNDEIDNLLRALMDYEQADETGVYCKVSRQAIHEAYELIRARYTRSEKTRNEWISVEDRLPPHPIKVALLSLRGAQREYGTGEYWPNSGMGSRGIWVSDMGHQITHWTSLPEVPTDGERPEGKSHG